jgi:PPOX class probable F420-dependent enzyme
MRRNLRPEDVAALLAAPKCATLATYRRDGTVLLSPVWHEWYDGGFSVVLSAGGINERLVRRDPRVSIVVYEDAPPYAGIELRGTARLSAEDGRDTLRRIAGRYLGDREAAAYVAGADWEDVVLRLEPGHLRVWDFVDEYGERGEGRPLA